jgi:hypothetical protein
VSSNSNNQLRKTIRKILNERIGDGAYTLGGERQRFSTDLFDDLFGFKAVKGFMGMIPASVTETWGGILATIWITGGFDKLSDFFGEGVSNDLFAVLFAKFFDEIISPQINRISVQDYFPNVYALFQQPVVGDAAVIREQGDIPEFKLALQRDLDSLVIRLRSLGQGTLSQQMDKLIEFLNSDVPAGVFSELEQQTALSREDQNIIQRKYNENIVPVFIEELMDNWEEDLKNLVVDFPATRNDVSTMFESAIRQIGEQQQ